MNFVRSSWTSMQGDPEFMRRLNGWLTIFWIVMIPVSIATGWIHSVAYVSALSLWALVSGHWSTWQAARVEVTQQREARERDENPMEERVVDKIVERTEIDEITGRVKAIGEHSRTTSTRGPSA
jgi:hypothetical protein